MSRRSIESITYEISGASDVLTSIYCLYANGKAPFDKERATEYISKIKHLCEEALNE